MFLSRNFKIALVALLVIALAGSAYAFAAANTVPNTQAGDGSGTVSGYSVSNIVYNLNATDPSTLDNVTFDLDSAAVTVDAQLVSSGGTFYTCTNTSLNTWQCDTSGLAVSTIDELRVIATSN